MTDSTKRTYRRFDTVQRVEHLILLVSFTVLAVTGLPQKFAEFNWGETLIGVMGGIETVRVIHRISAIVMMLVAVAHLVDSGYRMIVLRRRPYMLPNFDDVKDAWNALLFNLGLRKEHPVIGRFGYEEKAEYWALVWGTLIMMMTGFMLWNPITTTRFFRGEYVPAAKAAHGSEALLAVLAIILWHFYNVHLKHFNRSMFTGEMSEEEMAEYHAAELADLKAGHVPPVPEQEVIQKRTRVFTPVAGVLVVAWLIGLYLFATYEQTAITTLPERQEIEVFAPVTPTPQLIPATAQPIAEGEVAGEATWETVQALFEDTCGACHGTTAGLTLTDYESALAGGDSGPAIETGDAAASLLVQKQETGHPGQLDDAQLDLVRQWIDAGAPGPAGEAGEAASESEEEAEAGTEAEADVTWAADIQPILEETCGTCHGTTAGLTLTDYESALAGGDSGPAIEPGDAAASLLVEKQEAGHPGQLDDAQLDLVRQWIDAGAPGPAGEAGEAASESEADLTWAADIQPILEDTCGACHGTTAGLTLTDYESALAGGDSGPAIEPGDAAASLLVEKQEAGHPGQLDDAQLDLVRQWIDAGAPEEAGSEAEEEAEAEADLTWAADIQPILEETCGTCHGTTAGLTLTDYESALTGGDNGAAIEPGDAAASLLVEKQETGHPGQLDDAQLDLVRQWIDAGAPED